MEEIEPTPEFIMLCFDWWQIGKWAEEGMLRVPEKVAPAAKEGK